MGKPATITIDGEFDDWNESMIISTGGANDVCTAFKGSHENCVLDLYAVYAAWDDSNLYLAWQMCNTGDIWARPGDGPLTDYGRIGDVPLAVALSLNPRNVSMNGLNQYGKGIWGDKANMGYGFSGDAHVDAWLLMSGKPGQGDPALFRAKGADGSTCYDAPYCLHFKSAGIEYKMKEGFQPKSLWRQMTTADYDVNGALLSDPDTYLNVYDDECYFDILSEEYKEYSAEHGLKPHDTKYDSFYEIKIPFSALGIDRAYLEKYGVGVRIVATRGESAIDTLPHDPSMLDNVFGSYASDKSTSHEKDDFDDISLPSARVGAVQGPVESYPEPTVPVDPVVPIDPIDPVEGDVVVYFDNSTTGWSTVNCYIWDAGNGDKQYCGAWPGAAMTKGTYDGRELWAYALKTEDKLVKPMVIFNSGAQTKDLELVNHGIYTVSGFTGEVSGVGNIEVSGEEAVEYYNLQGMRVANPESGVFIRRAGNKVSKVRF